MSFTSEYSAIDYFRSVMAQWGLDQQSLIDWAIEKIKDGESADKILFDLERRPEFDAAFPEIKLRRDRAAADGLQLAPIGPGEVLEYRTRAKELMRSYGLPDNFYTTNANFQALIVNDVSLDELNQRLELSAKRVRDAPSEVKGVFEDVFGYDSDAALFLVFTNVDETVPALEEMVQVAEAGGAARRLGFGLSADEMRRVAGYNVTYDQAVEAFSGLDTARNLFDETISETEDFTVGQEGISAAFRAEGGAAERLERRGLARLAETQGGTGTATEERGVSGLGSAGRR